MVYNERRRGETRVRVVGRNNITFSHMVALLWVGPRFCCPRVADVRFARGGWHPGSRSAWLAAGPGRRRVSSGRGRRVASGCGRRVSSGGGWPVSSSDGRRVSSGGPLRTSGCGLRCARAARRRVLRRREAGDLGFRRGGVPLYVGLAVTRGRAGAAAPPNITFSHSWCLMPLWGPRPKRGNGASLFPSRLR